MSSPSKAQMDQANKIGERTVWRVLELTNRKKLASLARESCLLGCKRRAISLRIVSPTPARSKGG